LPTNSVNYSTHGTLKYSDDPRSWLIGGSSSMLDVKREESGRKQIEPSVWEGAVSFR